MEEIRPVGGELSGVIAGNSLARREPRLEHRIRVDLAPFTMDRAEQGATVEVVSLYLGVRSWRALPGRRYTFPAEPPAIMADGEAVPSPEHPAGWIRLQDRHIPLSLERLELGAVARGAIATALHVTLDGRERIVLQTELALAEVRVAGDLAMTPPSPEEAETLAGQVLDLQDYRRTQTGRILAYLPVVAGHGSRG